jgi:tetratricopeptide (TPR) repeat protein
MPLASLDWMDPSQPRKPLALEPMEEAPPAPESPRLGATAALSGLDPTPPPAAAPAPVERAQPERRAAPADEFLAQAAREYQQGQIDQPLWDITSAQFDHDNTRVVPAYLRIRARELRRIKRDGPSEERPRTESSSKKAPKAAPSRARPPLKYAVAAIGVAVGVALVWLLASLFDGDSKSQSNVVAAAPAKPAASPKPAPSKQPVVEKASGPPAPSDSDMKILENKVQALKQAGNWNVMVLYATEWTRKDPDNAAAWTDLSMGYSNLRQHGDALEAAQKAVKLSQHSRHVRNLGHVYLTLWRFPEARTAFDGILATNADDADALCGAAVAAKGQKQVKEVDAFAARLKSIDAKCDGLIDAESAPAVADSTAPRKAAPSRSR